MYSYHIGTYCPQIKWDLDSLMWSWHVEVNDVHQMKMVNGIVKVFLICFSSLECKSLIFLSICDIMQEDLTNENCSLWLLVFCPICMKRLLLYMVIDCCWICVLSHLRTVVLIFFIIICMLLFIVTIIFRRRYYSLKPSPTNKQRIWVFSCAMFGCVAVANKVYMLRLAGDCRDRELVVESL